MKRRTVVMVRPPEPEVPPEARGLPAALAAATVPLTERKRVAAWNRLRDQVRDKGVVVVEGRAASFRGPVSISPALSGAVLHREVRLSPLPPTVFVPQPSHASAAVAGEGRSSTVRSGRGEGPPLPPDLGGLLAAWPVEVLDPPPVPFGGAGDLFPSGSGGLHLLFHGVEEGHEPGPPVATGPEAAVELQGRLRDVAEVLPLPLGKGPAPSEHPPPVPFRLGRSLCCPLEGMLLLAEEWILPEAWEALRHRLGREGLHPAGRRAVEDGSLGSVPLTVGSDRLLLAPAGSARGEVSGVARDLGYVVEEVRVADLLGGPGGTFLLLLDLGELEVPERPRGPGVGDPWTWM